MKKIKLLIKVAILFFKHPIKNFNALKSKSLFYYLKKIFVSANDVDSKVNAFFTNDKYIANKNNFTLFNEKKYRNIYFRKESNPIISIVIPTFNNFNHLYNCLLSIKESVKSNIIKYEIIVIDDYSKINTKKKYSYLKNIKILYNNEKIGYIKSVNKAAKNAKGKYLYFLNDEFNMQKNSLNELLEIFNLNKSIGIAGSKIIYRNGTLEIGGGIIWKNGDLFEYGNHDKSYKSLYNYTKEVDYVSRFSLLIKTKLWENIKGFDEAYIPTNSSNYETVDLCFNARKLGYSVVYTPSSIVVRSAVFFNKNSTNNNLKKIHIFNKKIFTNKWLNYLNEQQIKDKNLFLARERNITNKTMLFIDHRIPTPDQDAGSKSVFSFIQILLKNNYKIKFLTNDFYFLEPYTSNLEKLGVEVLYEKDQRFDFELFIKNNGQYFEYAFINRPFIAKNYIPLIKSNSKAKIIYYGHDLHFLRLKREYDISKDSAKLIESRECKKIEMSIFKSSDIIFYPSPSEIKEIKKINKNLNAYVLQPYMFENKKFNSVTDKKNNICFVGGFEHKPNVDACIWFIKEIFPLIEKNNPKIIFNIVGSHPSNEIMNLAKHNIKIFGYVSDDKLSKILDETLVFVAPLRYGAGIKGKIIEAMYHSLPIVTTKCGAEGIHNASKCLLIADNPSEFAKFVNMLIHNKNLRNSYGYRAKTIINKYYTISNATVSLINAIEKKL